MPPGQADNWRFWRLFNYQDGLVCRIVPAYERDGTRLKQYRLGAKVHLKQVGWRRAPLWRRQFMERYLRIRGTDARLHRFALNPAQRGREAMILRQEREGLPVRVVDLKGRQLGMTTHSIGVAVDAFLRMKRQRALVVSQDEETAAAALEMSGVMLEEMPRAGNLRWHFDFNTEQTTFKTLAAPQNSGLRIASAKKTNPGRGLTYSIGVFDEAAFWEGAVTKARSLTAGLPNEPGTIGLLFSTANGAQGYFFETFMAAWRERGIPLRQRTQEFSAGFYPWFINPKYRFTLTFGAGAALPERTKNWLLATLTEHERELMGRAYFRRWQPDDAWALEAPEPGTNPRWRRVGVGWRHVDIDQLAWRRSMVVKLSGDPLRPETWGGFQAEFPSTAEEAFIATGRVAFDQGAVQAALRGARNALWRGDILDITDANSRAGPLIPGGTFTKQQLGLQADPHDLQSRGMWKRKIDLEHVDAG